jgi:phosphoribosylformimino-5-aminoimidazole carboxamide ribotide isomerase
MSYIENIKELAKPPLGSLGVIPAIDIIDGKCVRLTKGDYNIKTIYNENPVAIAKQFEDAGLQRLHLVDLDGAKAGNVLNWKVLENIALQTKLRIDFSGGLSTTDQVEKCFNNGAAFASIGSIAVKNEHLFNEWITKFGADKFIVGADVNDEKIAIKGWTEQTKITVFELIEKYITKGITQFFVTDISKDGLLQGPSIDLYKKILEQFPTLQLIASGGVSNLDDLNVLKEIGCSAAIVGKAIYENKISIDELRNLNIKNS